MKYRRITIFILALIMIILISCTNLSTKDEENVRDNPANLNNSFFTSTNDSMVASEVTNPFFFKDGEKIISYKGIFAAGMEGELLECNIKLKIVSLGRCQNGKLYNIRVDPSDSALRELSEHDGYWGDLDYWTDHLNLGYFYVAADKIYKLTMIDNLDMIMIDENKSQHYYITCQDEELIDMRDPDENGWHHYIRVNGNQRESHFYNTAVETGYYEHITWENEVGLVRYASGYGAEREKIELNIIP